MALTVYTWTVIIFAIVLLIFIWMDRKNFSRQGIIFLRRTEKGKYLVDRLAKRYPRFWRFYGNLGMVVFIPAMLITVGLFAHTLYTVFAVPETRGVGLLLPSPTAEVKLLPGIVAIPFWFWLLGIVIIAVVHELAHGIIARREGIAVKSLGGVLFGPILGAFVEIDEKQMRKKDWKITARIASAGALTNMVFCVIFLILFIISIMALYQTHGLAFAVDPNGPLNQTNITFGILQSLNGVEIETDEELMQYLRTTEPGDVIDVHYMDTNFSERSATITLAQRPDNQTHGYLGIRTNDQDLFGIVEGSQYRTALALPKTTEFFTQFLAWVAMLNLLVGLFNLLPAKPLDGGLIWESYAKRVSKKHAAMITKVAGRTIYAMFLLLLIAILRSVFI